MNDKRVLIYNAVLSLIKENGLHSKLKISDIADKANIGKGTVYEYFSSKEEIIVESIIYLISTGMQGVLKYNNEENTDFEEKLKKYIHSLLSALSKNSSIHSLFVSQNVGSMLSMEMKMKIKESVEKIKNKHDEIFNSIVKQGISEKILPSEISKFNITAAKMIIMPLLVEYIHCNNEIAQSEDEFMDNIYNIIVKMLS